MTKEAEVGAFNAPRFRRMTFHKFLPGCQQGDRESWRAFLSNYTPVALRLCSPYLPLALQEQMAFWHDALLALWANDYGRLRGFPQQTEQEFLVGLRGFLLESALPLLDPSKDSTAPPLPTVKMLGELAMDCPSGGRFLPARGQTIAFR